MRPLALLVLLLRTCLATVIYEQDFSPARRGTATLRSYVDTCRFDLTDEVLAITTDAAGRGGADLMIPVEAGEVALRWRYRDEPGLAAGAAMVRLGVYDRRKHRRSWPDSGVTLHSHEGVADVKPSESTLNLALAATPEWQTATVRLRLPEGVGWLLVNLCAFHGGGTLRYDDVVLDDLAAPREPVDLPLWESAWPDPTRPAAGYPVLANVEEVIVHRATPATGTFNHIPQLTIHDGTFYLAWNNHARDEDAIGQRILGSRSPDGRHWSPAEEWLPPVPERFLTILPMRFSPSWQTLDGRLYLIASRFSGGGARGYRDEEARHVSASGLGPIAILSRDHPLLATRGSWAPRLEPDPACVSWSAEDGCRLIERTVYRRPDGVLVALARQAGPTFLMYAALSRNDGRSWSPFRRSNIPDSPSLATSGTLPDGRVYLVHSPVAQVRDPLVISLSSDGIVFDQTVALRSDMPPVKYDGRNKLPGFQYPSAVVNEGSLWVAYAIGKEDIAIARVALSELPRRSR